MELSDLGTPAQLWARWVLVAAGHAAAGLPGFEIRRSDGCALLGDDRAWLRLRRLGGNRAVIWGHHDDVPVEAHFLDALRDEAPDWSYDVDSKYAARQVGFLGWHAHGSWSSVPPLVPDPVVDLLALLAHDDAVRAWWRARWPDADEAELRAAIADPEGPALVAVVGSAAAAARAVRQVALGRTWSTRQLSDNSTAALRSAIHAQMRTGHETDRGHPSRPPLLRQWARVNASGMSFTHAVCALGQSATPTLVPSSDNQGLTGAQARTLDNVLMELRMSETDEASGAWLFARVTGVGPRVVMERRFDTWPSWWRAPTGPTMAALHTEMAQRSATSRPSWAQLLPPGRF